MCICTVSLLTVSLCRYVCICSIFLLFAQTKYIYTVCVTVHFYLLLIGKSDEARSAGRLFHRSGLIDRGVFRPPVEAQQGDMLRWSSGSQGPQCRPPGEGNHHEASNSQHSSGLSSQRQSSPETWLRLCASPHSECAPLWGAWEAPQGAH